jgi:hypothetical protein
MACCAGYRQSTSDYVMAAAGAGLGLDHLSELAPDARFARRFPRTLKHVGWPIEARQRQVLADRAGSDRVSLLLERPDPLEGVQRDCPLGTAVVAQVRLPITVDAAGADAGGLARRLRNPAIGDVV